MSSCCVIDILLLFSIPKRLFEIKNVNPTPNPNSEMPGDIQMHFCIVETF